MSDDRTAFLRRLGEKLHAYFDDIAREPLPQKWVDLIQHLNEQERIRAQSEQQSERPGRQG